jgi:hypothetical protein
VKIISAVFKIFSLLFHLIFSFMLFLFFAVGAASEGSTLQLGMLPWEGSQMHYSLLALSLAGFLFVILSAQGVMRILFFIWNLATLYLLVDWFWLSNYRFPSEDQYTFALYLTGLALVALLGSILLLRAPLFAKKKGS